MAADAATLSLTPLQQGMLFHHLLDAAGGTDIEQIVVALPERVDAAALRAAWNAVAARHDALRTSFRAAASAQPIQVVHPTVELPWEELDWRGNDVDERLHTWLRVDRQRGFDLASPPLARLTLVRLADAEYRLIWTFHHIILDGRSFTMVLREAFARYDARATGGTVALPPAPRFSDHVAWVESLEHAGAEGYWRERLRGFSAPTPLPASWSLASDVSNARGGELEYRLDSAATTALRAWAACHDLTMNTIVQGVWSLLLWRHSAERDVVFGVTRAGRRSGVAGADAMVGLLINTLPLRVEIEPERSLADWLREVRTRWRELRDVEQTPLVQVQGWSDLPAGAALFDSLVVFESVLLEDAMRALGGAWSSRRVRVHEQPNFALTLGAYDGASLALKLDHDRTRVADDTAERLLGQLVTMLEGIAAHPDVLVRDVSILPEGERHSVVAAWNETAREAPKTTLHALIAARAAERPDAIALLAGETTVTYRELMARAECVAAALRAAGVERGAVVGILVERSFAYPISVLGVLLAGGAWLSLDPAYPAERLGFMIEDSGAQVVLTQHGLAGRVPAAARALCVEDMLDGSVASAPAPPTIAAGAPGDVAYVIYTSGSTGRPKGTLLSHRGICNLALAQRELLEVEPGSRVLQFASPGFDASVWELVSALCSGASLQIMPQEVLSSPDELARRMAAEGTTIVTLPPTLLRLIDPATIPSLRTVISAGEALSSDLVARWATGRRLMNGYGPTETSVCATIALCTPDDASPPPIGRPIPNVRVYVLDEWGAPLPVGAPGELWIAGVGVALGYLNRPDLTAERFRRDPFATGLPSDVATARMYRSGDRVRWRPDGQLEYLGRLDDQVKLRGMRVELGEVEAALAALPTVREVVALVRRDHGEDRLVAYVVPRKGVVVEPGALRDALATTLPEHMLPSAFVPLERIPLTTSGKVDRRALPVPDVAPAALAYEAPRTPTEAIVCRVWAEVLGVPRVGRRDSFFLLGGHSLLAARASGRVATECGIRLPLRTLFETRTAGAFATAVDAARGGAAWAAEAEPAAEPVAVGEPTPAQRLLWTLQAAVPTDVTYNIPDALRIDAAIDQRALEGALQDLVARHEALRMRFEDASGAVRFVVEPSVRAPLETIDLSTVAEDARDGELHAVLDRLARTPFDLRRAPALRAALVRLSAERHVLVTVTHHIVSDGWSRQLLLRDLGALYDARVRGEAPRLPAIAEPYSALLARRERRRRAAGERQLGYWREQLAGGSFALDLPTDRSRVATPSFEGAFRTRVLPPELMRRVDAIAHSYDATPYMVLLAAFQTLLHRYTGQTDLVVGSALAGRAEESAEHLGYFVNMVALRAAFGDAPSFAALVARTRDAVLGAIEHQDAALADVAAAAQVRPAAGGALVQAAFVMQNLAAAALRVGGIAAAPEFVHTGTAKFELMLTATPRGDTLALELEYRTGLFDDATIARLLEHYVVLLEGAVSAPEEAVGRLPILTPAERHRILVEWNDTDASWPEEATIHGLFEAQVARWPDRIAVVSEEATLTYAQLDAQAEALAARLRAAGVGPGVLTVVCLRRSAASITTILAVLKAGGAYVPVDSEYPDERVAYLLEDSAAPVVLTERALAHRFAGAAARVLCADDPTGDSGVAAAHAPAARSTDLAYVIYTSGSTGRPKGVLIEHRSVVRLLVNSRLQFHFDERDVWTVFHSFSFDFSVWEMYGALLYGGTAVVVSRDTARSPSAFLELLERARVTVLNQTPSAFYALAAELDGRPRAELQLRYVIFGGEALKPALLRGFHARYPETTLVNMFGITETTVHVTYKRIGEAEIAGGVSNVGGPIPTLTTYVLDAELQLVPPGVFGELCVGGLGVARGYLNRPTLTAERFVPHPFRAGDRLYRSGDIGRLRPNGDIEYLGRRDGQVKVRGYRIELGEVEAALAQHQAVREVGAMVREDVAGDKRLVAYYVTNDDTLGAEALRAFVRERLPEHMVPSALMRLRALPRTGNGKLDRAALPAPAREMATSDQYVAPSTDAERALEPIWREVLRVDRVGMHDNFFELGGDSLLGIQVVARARRAGLGITLKQLFELGTIAALAAVASEAIAAPAVAVASGLFPLTPIQQWFFERNIAERGYWNQSFTFVTPAELDVDRLVRALRAIEVHHDALRLRFERTGDGWMQRHVPAGDGPPLVRHDLSAVPPAERPAAIARIANAAQRGLDIEHGPLWRCELVSCGTGEPGRLVVAVHHLAVDGVSWSVLMEDLESAYRADGATTLPSRTAPYSEWSRALATLATSPALQRERSYWAGALDGVRALPRDASDGVTHEARKRTVTRSLDSETTTALLREAPAAYATQVNDLLLAALARALAGWTDAPAVGVDLEAHGREEVGRLDVSRTVGWFTAIHPVRLELRGAGDTTTLIKRTKELLRAVPRHGLGFGVLRHLGATTELAALPQPDIAFNYLGQFDQLLARSATFALAPEQPTELHDPGATRVHLLEIDCLVLDGRLEMRWGYSEEAHHAATIERLATAYTDALRDVTLHCLRPEAGGRTASDFPLAQLDQAGIDALVGDGRGVDDVYPATPVQRLFHAVSQGGADVGFEQWAYELDGALDAERLAEAWQRVVDRHPALRTALVPATDGRLMQVVLRRVRLPVAVLDWRGMATDAQRARMDELLAADRARGFDVRVAPLMRVTLVRLDERRWCLVWSQHHLMSDRWSFPLVLDEVGRVYRALMQGATAVLEPAPLYRDYMAWLAVRSPSGAHAFWGQTLAGLAGPTPLPAGRPVAGVAETPTVQTLRLSEDATARIVAAARARRLTTGTLVQGAWALWLASRTGRDDIVFGATMAGRPPEVAGIDRMLGMFINNVPVRARVSPTLTLTRFLETLHGQIAQAREFDWTPPDVIHEASGLPGRLRLFDSLVVVQGAAAEEASRAWLGPDITIRPPAGVSATGFALTLFAVEGRSLELSIAYPTGRYDATDVREWLDALRTLLAALTADAAHTVGDALALVPAVAEPSSDEVPVAAAYVAPRSNTEWVLVSMWGELLGLERIGVDDDFFALGGHSLLLTQLASRVREDLQRDLPLRAFFEAPTVAGVARALAADDAAGRTERIAGVLRRVAEMSASDVAAATATLALAPSRETIR